MKEYNPPRDVLHALSNSLLPRAALYDYLQDYRGGRDYNKEFGYPDSPTTEQYRGMYDRVGVAARVVKCMPEECWAVQPEVYETEGEDVTAFEEVWTHVAQDKNVWHYLQRADELSGIGRFGIVLIGLDDGLPLDSPVEGMPETGDWRDVGVGKGKERKLLYLRVFDESLVTIKNRETDSSSPRYNQPTLYAVKMSGQSSGSGVQQEVGVHWHRVIHVADNRVDSEVYGTPRLKDVYNRMCDIRKILGGSGEMFWKGALPGYSFEVDPDLAEAGAEMDVATVREEMTNYVNGLQRFIALNGVSVKPLSPQVTSPSPFIEAQLKATAISKSIPFRILFGSEQAQLASTQDARRWNSRLAKRQTTYLTPMLIRPFVSRLVCAGVLPTPEEFTVVWPDLNSLTELEQATIAQARVKAFAVYVSGGVSSIMPPRTFLTRVMGYTAAEADAIEEEAREYVLEEEAGMLGDAASASSDFEGDTSSDEPSGGDAGAAS